mmetsp:Transcript_25567/g.58113  ORF Transcript_25567/g.58113 Transcript_25567/m.58113 type:complete len:217 (-) Transcript_25567:92-742(-)
MSPSIMAAPREIARSESPRPRVRAARDGMIMARTDSSRRLDCMRAPSALYLWLWNLMPPRAKHIPITSSKLLRMLPSRLPCTTSTRPSLNANTDRIISTAFPKVAFRRPPSVSPTAPASSSVAPPSIPARGRMATKFRPKMTSSPHPRCGEAMAKGTISSSTFRGLWQRRWRNAVQSPPTECGDSGGVCAHFPPSSGSLLTFASPGHSSPPVESNC